MKIKPLLYFFITTLFTTAADSAVILKNGNFNVSYDDLTVDQRTGLVLARHYNSVSTQMGWFGRGWGTAFETRLWVMPDGMVAAYENGNGHITMYGEPDDNAIKKAVDLITQTLLKNALIRSNQETSMREQLQTEPLLRLQWSWRLQLHGPLPEVGTRLVGSEFESAMDRFARLDDREFLRYAFITDDREGAIELLQLKYDYIDARSEACGQLLRTKEGFERAICSNNRFGDQQRFDREGRLTHLNNENHWLRLDYEKSTRPQKITNEAGQSISIKWNEQGFVEQIIGIEEGRSRTHRYAYDHDGNLLSIDMNGGNRYDYAYDNNHLLTRIRYIDDSTKTIQYDSNYRVTHITQRNGNHAYFVYETNAQGDTTIRYLTALAGDEPNVRRTVKYNQRGQLLMNRDTVSSLEYDYHPTFHGVSLYKDDEFDCRFDYNDKGKLTRESCPRQNIDNRLDYDSAGNVVKTTLSVPDDFRDVISDSSVTIKIDYDRLGRVTLMREVGHAPYIAMNYRDDNDREGERAEQSPSHHDTAQLRFIKALDLQARAMEGIEKRTRAFNGFFVAQE